MTLPRAVYFHHPELDLHNGQEVLVSYDLMSEEQVWIKDLEGALVCVAKFYKSRGHRSLSAYELALGKRADAAIKRHLVKIDYIESERPEDFIEGEVALSEEQQRLGDQKYKELILADSQEELQEQLLISSQNGRPVFLLDSDKYDWLKINPNDITDDDQGWLSWYQETSEYRLLFGDDDDANDLENIAR